MVVSVPAAVLIVMLSGPTAVTVPSTEIPPPRPPIAPKPPGAKLPFGAKEPPGPNPPLANLPVPAADAVAAGAVTRPTANAIPAAATTAARPSSRLPPPLLAFGRCGTSGTVGPGPGWASGW